MIDEARAFGRGLSFPPRIGQDGRLSWSAGPSNIRECIRVLLLTVPGERLFRADYGADLRRILFEPNTTSTRREIRNQIERALSAWEPRVEVEAIEVEEDPADGRTAIATIRYRLVATRASEELNLRFQLAS
jgi:phage baseplate assembly protein W